MKDKPGKTDEILRLSVPHTVNVARLELSFLNLDLIKFKVSNIDLRFVKYFTYGKRL